MNSLSSYFWDFVHFPVLNTGSVISWYFTNFLFPLSSRCRSRHTWRWESRRNVFLHVCHQGIVVLILSSRRILSFSVIRLCSRMYWHEIAAAAAAAAASWRQRFPDARSKIHLRFNVVRILFHGRLWRFAIHIIEVLFLLLNKHYLGVKDLLFILLGFPKHASLRHRSPESSEPYVTLDSRSSPIRTTFGVHTSFFPGSHLRVSRTPQTFGVTWRILSHKYAVPRDETTCACFHIQRELSEGLPQDLFIGTNSCAKL